VFIDHLRADDGAYAADRERNFLEEHRDDHRVHWRVSSRSLRPCPHARCAAPLMQLVAGRLNEDVEITGVHLTGNLSVRFQLVRQPSLRRTLTFVIAESGTDEWR